LSDYAGQSQRAAAAWLRPGNEIGKSRDAERGSDYNEQVAFNEEGHGPLTTSLMACVPYTGPAYFAIAGEGSIRLGPAGEIRAQVTK
jgi:hypothetical protein